MNINEVNKQKRDELRNMIKEIAFQNVSVANETLQYSNLLAEIDSDGNTVIKNADGHVVATIKKENSLD